MKLEIDTKRDSVEDIKKTIEFLQKFIDESNNSYSSYSSSSSNNIQPPQPTSTPSVDSGAFNMFGDDSSSTPVTNAYEYETKVEKDDDDDEPAQISIVEY